MFIYALGFAKWWNHLPDLFKTYKFYFSISVSVYEVGGRILTLQH